MKHVTELVERG